MLEIATPERYGGNGHEIDLMFEAAMEIGRGCGSAAWNYAVWDIHNWMVGHWPEQAQEDYFATGPNTLSSSSFAPNGRLEPVEGGFRLSGRWEFSSGSDGGTWALLGAMSDRGPVFVLVPRPDYTVLQDTWYVSGLKGTGSKDVVVDGAFVPAHRLQPMMGMGPMSGAWQLHQRDSYRLFSMSLLPFTLCSPIVGMARGAIEVFTEELKAKLASSHMPYLYIVGPLNSGKLTLLKLLWCFCRRGLLSGDLRSASLYKLIDTWQPTLLIDELETGSRADGELSRLLRTGSTPGIPAMRDGQPFATYGLKIISSRQPPSDAALLSRGLILSMLPTDDELMPLDDVAIQVSPKNFSPNF